jgi:hypothetical protein
MLKKDAKKLNNYILRHVSFESVELYLHGKGKQVEDFKFVTVIATGTTVQSALETLVRRAWDHGCADVAHVQQIAAIPGYRLPGNYDQYIGTMLRKPESASALIAYAGTGLVPKKR